MSDRRRAVRRDPSARFYLDEDVRHGAAAIGVALGLDIVAAKAAQPSLPQDDPIHLQMATSDGRILVTYNRDDFIRATRDAFAKGLPQAGLLILTHKLPRDAARVAHSLGRWVESRKARSCWPMQSFEIDFLSD